VYNRDSYSRHNVFISSRSFCKVLEEGLTTFRYKIDTRSSDIQDYSDKSSSLHLSSNSCDDDKLDSIHHSHPELPPKRSKREVLSFPLPPLLLLQQLERSPSKVQVSPSCPFSLCLFSLPLSSTSFLSFPSSLEALHLLPLLVNLRLNEQRVQKRGRKVILNREILSERKMG